MYKFSVLASYIFLHSDKKMGDCYIQKERGETAIFRKKEGRLLHSERKRGDCYIQKERGETATFRKKEGRLRGRNKTATYI